MEKRTFRIISGLRPSIPNNKCPRSRLLTACSTSRAALGQPAQGRAQDQNDDLPEQPPLSIRSSPRLLVARGTFGMSVCIDTLKGCAQLRWAAVSSSSGAEDKRRGLARDSGQVRVFPFCLNTHLPSSESQARCATLSSSL